MGKRVAGVVLTTAVVAGCGTPDGSTPTGEVQVVRDSVGDTLVVRTLSGSAWGAEATLVPEVSIGELDGALEYIFGSIRSLAVAGDGTVR